MPDANEGNEQTRKLHAEEALAELKGFDNSASTQSEFSASAKDSGTPLQAFMDSLPPSHQPCNETERRLMRYAFDKGHGHGVAVSIKEFAMLLVDHR